MSPGSVTSREGACCCNRATRTILPCLAPCTNSLVCLVIETCFASTIPAAAMRATTARPHQITTNRVEEADCLLSTLFETTSCTPKDYFKLGSLHLLLFRCLGLRENVTNLCIALKLAYSLATNERINNRNNQQGHKGSSYQTANDGSTKRCVLLTPRTKGYRHR